ncbi:glycosyltransferase [Lutibacter maritimus]|uniref:Glycosyltransferase involved in cell wall bisynthesis n=1 Tax=Lutibacter maritimus TaxID=593133 RepID=A0A1I6R615_9FLAO|nr:glycosyltransferase [Lutibacter maritimus]SFS60133.1 Glycosyltransferase involved in cell wall bisynthesis [Lutibacter maritimus]
MKRIIVSVTNDLVTDQRVHKSCTTLFNNGFDILLIGRKLKNSKQLTRSYKTKRIKLYFNKGFLFYAEYNIRLFLKLLFTKKDILLANDLDTLLPNYLISKLFSKNLVYDSHELFTEVPELINRPFKQNIWKFFESSILPRLNNQYTVCDSIATYYNTKYKTNFYTIRNFPLRDSKQDSTNFPFEINSCKIILYQGALNLGRGIELIIKTMLFLNNTILVIIGNGDIEKELIQKVINLNLENKVKFINKLNPAELKKITPLADLGISFEEDLGLNYRYALPNKLFDYIQAKVPVLVSDLPEMKNIVSKYKVGEVITDRTPKELASQINKILENGKDYYNTNLEIASKELIWEKESKKLIEIFKNLN